MRIVSILNKEANIGYATFYLTKGDVLADKMK